MSYTEFEEFHAMLADTQHEAAMLQLMKEAWNNSQPAPEYLQDDRDLELPQQAATVIKSIRRIPFLRGWWAAACIVLLLGAGIYLWVYSGNSDPAPMAGQPVQNDIFPGKDGVMLTLADGRQVVLDSLNNGMIAMQEGSRTHLENGRLIYDPTGETSGTMLYNTMTTPGGRQFQVILPDGTKVWLNAASSITYPTAFSGRERQVKITGEAYFEVAGDPRKPFTVNINDAASIAVIGTSFNVNAYADENAIKTTLLEGSVKVMKGASAEMLRPGEQAAISDEIHTTTAVNIDQVMAWKNGLFNFRGDDIKSVMREIGRWYDLEIVYESEPRRRKISGEMQRNLSLSQVMIVLKKLNINYRVEGRKLIVTR